MPNLNDLWMDTSVTPAVLRRWDGSHWEVAPLAALVQAIREESRNTSTDDGRDRIDSWIAAVETFCGEVARRLDKIERIARGAAH